MSDTDRAWMRHPDLDGYEPTPVVRSQLPTFAASGWVECDPPPAPKPPKDDEADGTKPPAKETAPRRKKSEDD